MRHVSLVDFMVAWISETLLNVTLCRFKRQMLSSCIYWWHGGLQASLAGGALYRIQQTGDMCKFGCFLTSTIKNESHFSYICDTHFCEMGGACDTHEEW